MRESTDAECEVSSVQNCAPAPTRTFADPFTLTSALVVALTCAAAASGIASWAASAAAVTSGKSLFELIGPFAKGVKLRRIVQRGIGVGLRLDFLFRVDVGDDGIDRRVDRTGGVQLHRGT